MRLPAGVKKVSAVLALLLAGYFCISAFGAYRALEVPRLPLATLSFPDEISPEDVSFGSRGDGVLLKGWLFTGIQDRAVIFMHGGYQNRVDETVDTSHLTYDLVERGFSVLLFDLRGRGESEGRGQVLSNIDADVGGAVDFLSSRGFQTKNMGILGFCSGAASTAIFASRNEIGAVVLDGCFADVNGMLKRQASIAGVPGFFSEMFTPGMFVMARLLFNYRPVNPADVIDKAACPIYFIYEALDWTIPETDVRTLLVLSANPVNRLWVIPGALHSEGYRTVPSEYVQNVSGFFNAAFDSSSSGIP